MTYKNDEEIEKIAAGFIDLSLPKERWTHAAHFATAVWLIRHPEYDAFTQMPDMIRRFNEAKGGINSDSEGYHETITQASLRATAAYIALVPAETALTDIVNGLLAGNYGKPGWLLEYWTKDRLFSALARRDWVEPDIKALPF